jgi:hypothetical protein
MRNIFKFIKRILKAIALAGFAFVVLALASCGVVLEYETEHGIIISEKIDGKLNPKISTDRVNLNDVFKR